jgi:Protein-arginine deiminase (PAD)
VRRQLRVMAGARIRREPRIRLILTPRVDLDGLGKRDLFQEYARKVFLRAGYKQIRFVDSTLYHNAGGSIQCGTNAIRKLPTSLWWEINLA